MNPQEHHNATASIGEIISAANQLSGDQIERIVSYQKSQGVRFGEAAVALGLAKREDVLWALSQQFDYPYANGSIGPELQCALQPFSQQAEAIRSLRSQLIGGALTLGASKRPLAILSPCQGDGKTYIAANLAISLSQMGAKVALVDADMRTPRQHQVFQMTDVRTGLSSVLASRGEITMVRPIDSLPTLYLMPVGITPPNPLELIQRPAFGELLSALLVKFDHVIVDTPAADHGSDARSIAQACQNVLLVGRKDHTRTKQMNRFIDSIKGTVGHIAGMVMNEHA